MSESDLGLLLSSDDLNVQNDQDEDDANGEFLVFRGIMRYF